MVRHQLIGACSADALAFYLFLVTVADAEGLSYYSDPSILCRLPFLNAARLTQVRVELQQRRWIAYKPPLYQVLALDGAVPERPRALQRSPSKPSTSRRTAQPTEIIQLLRRALEGNHD
ncbi:MAG: hypothetical protein V3V31_15085 [Methylococcales bacterium]